MKAVINKLSHDRYTVNGKLVVRNMDDWIGHDELTTREVSEFQKHILNTENSPLTPEGGTKTQNYGN